MTLQRGFITLGNGKQVHYRRSGSGPPLVMLHPSPQCSEMLLPAVQAFAPYCTCIALDTPGYGLSDDIDIERPSIGDYVDPIREAIDRLGIGRFCLYGSATGAQIAIAFGKAYPERLSLLMLDANGHVEDEERQRVLDGYMPGVAPQRNGSHLLTYWEMCQRLFISFPWHSALASDRLDIGVPPAAVIQQILLRYLRAGESYTNAYLAAFEAESIDFIRDLKVPTTMLRWEGSIILNLTDDMIARGLPDNISINHAGPTLDDRYGAQIKVLEQRYRDGDGEFTEEFPQENTDTTTLKRTFWGTGDALLHVRENSTGAGRPVVILHDAGQSGVQVLDLAQDVLGQRPVYVVDLPGHGESADNTNDGQPTMETLADPVVSAMRHLDVADADLVGVGLGAAVAISVSQAVKTHQVVLIEPFVVKSDAEETASIGRLTDLTPRRDGAHLLAAWSIACSGESFAPWFDNSQQAILHHDANLDPHYLHDRACDLLKLRYSYEDLHNLARTCDWPIQMERSSAKIAIGRSPRQSARTAGEWPELRGAAVIDLPDSRREWLEFVFGSL